MREPAGLDARTSRNAAKAPKSAKFMPYPVSVKSTCSLTYELANTTATGAIACTIAQRHSTITDVTPFGKIANVTQVNVAKVVTPIPKPGMYGSYCASFSYPNSGV